MKSIKTLVEDIHSTLEKGIDATDQQVDEFASSLALMLKEKLQPRKQRDYLSMSMLGTQCNRKLWYQVNEPTKAIPINGQTRFKFLYGDIIEHLTIWLAKLSGHEVKGEQLEVEIDGIKGHSDVIIDGVMVDVKSANSRSFMKFQDHKLEEDDPFGYIDQINSYLYSNQTNDDLRVKGEAAFLAIDKELGKMCLDFYKSNGKDYHKLVAELKEMIAKPKPPTRAFMPEPDGKSGNLKLGTQCKYCDFKMHCFPGTRVFLYSNGPRFLTHVEKEPEVKEITSEFA